MATLVIRNWWTFGLEPHHFDGAAADRLLVTLRGNSSHVDPAVFGPRVKWAARRNG